MTLMLFEDMIKGKVKSEEKECVGEQADVRHECTRCRAKPQRGRDHNWQLLTDWRSDNYARADNLDSKSNIQ